MKISDIDKDFVNIIEYLDAKEFKPFASCDGVIANHSEDEKPSFYAYISFLKSERIIDLMAAFMTDEKFMVAISTPSDEDEYELYGNIITGNQYSVYFNNKQGENTDHLEQIIRDVTEEKLVISEQEKEKLEVLNQVLEEDDELSFEIRFNDDYQPYMKKSGKTNVLMVGTKANKRSEMKNMKELASVLADKYGLVVKSSELTERFDDSKEFITYWSDDSCAEYYFQNERIPMVLDMIRYSRKMQSQLETFLIEEIDYDEEEIQSSTQLEVDENYVAEILTLMQEKERLLGKKEDAEKLLKNYEKQLSDQVTHDEN